MIKEVESKIQQQKIDDPQQVSGFNYQKRA